MGRISQMTHKGHEEITWDPNDEESVAEARARFDDLKEAGYTFYTKDKGSVEEFDSEQAEMIAVMPMAGG